MDRPAFDALCASLPATFMVAQWGAAHVWKVGNAEKNKVFALSAFWVGKDGVDADDPRNGQHGIVFKVAPMSFEMLTQEAGIAQAPYFAKGHWVRVVEEAPLGDDDLGAYIREAHRIMAASLTKKLQSELGLTAYVAEGLGRAHG
ncbi:MAG: MmcQ/YjbR family DNA-binding protein [Devosiaceae bacterium]|nr:MmcQ/YjbR family DNA-binding protein [Devosiaceae bacterium MH13]